MYNRYIPQPDGSFRRNTVATPQQRQSPPAPQKQEIPCAEPPQPQVDPPCTMPASRQGSNAGDFLKRLLPRNLDTGDLLIILLLLLMAGDHADDQNTAMLTLLLYLFM